MMVHTVERNGLDHQPCLYKWHSFTSVDNIIHSFKDANVQGPTCLFGIFSLVT